METNNGPANNSDKSLSLEDAKSILFVSGAREYYKGHLWEALLNQDEYWIPRSAWAEYTKTFRNPDPSIVEGAMRLTDLDEEYRTSLIEFIWKRTRNIVKKLSSYDAMMLAYPDAPDEVLTDIENYSDQMNDYAENTEARRLWFEGKPFIKALRTSLGQNKAAPSISSDLTALFNSFFGPAISEQEKQAKVAEVTEKVTEVLQSVAHPNITVTDKEIDSFHGHVDFEGSPHTYVENTKREVQFRKSLSGTSVDVIELQKFLATSTANLSYSPSSSLEIEGGTEQDLDYGEEGLVPCGSYLKSATLVLTGYRYLTPEERDVVKAHILKSKGE